MARQGELGFPRRFAGLPIGQRQRTRACATQGQARYPTSKIPVQGATDRAEALFDEGALVGARSSPFLQAVPLQWLTPSGGSPTMRGQTARGGDVGMDSFWRLWSRLEMWQKFGLTFIGAVVILVLIRTLF